MQVTKTQPFAPEPRTPEELLETGLPNLWYLIARSEDVADRPVALKRLDRNIVLWRGREWRAQRGRGLLPASRCAAVDG